MNPLVPRTATGSSVDSAEVSGLAALNLQTAFCRRVFGCMLRNLFVLLVLTTLAACGSGSSGGNSAGGVTSTNTAPVAAFTATPASGMEPLLVMFDASASHDSDGQIVSSSYNWNFGDNTTGSGVTVGHTYTAAGSFTVTLTVTDNAGATGTTSQVISVTSNVAPVAVISVDRSTGAAPLVITANANASSDADGTIVSIAWAFGDGGTATGAVVTHTYAVDGTYTLRLTVTDDQGAMATTTATIVVITRVTLSGHITAANNTAVDSDVNDPLARFVSNDTSAQAQALQNPVVVAGFVSAVGTGIPGDRFARRGDTIDYYAVHLLAGQFVSLRIADFNRANPAAVDIDIFLYDANLTQVAFSATLNEFESMMVPAEGDYVIQVQGSSGISKYFLSIGSVSLISGRLAYGSPADFVPEEAILKFKSALQAQALRAQLRSVPSLAWSNNDVSRLALLSWHQPGAMAATADLLNLRDRLAAVTGPGLPAETVAKLQTLEMIKALRSRPDMVYAEPNYRVQPMRVPNDRFFDLQAHYPQINLPQAWDITTGTPTAGQIIVAVVDTGVFLAHEDFAGKLVNGFDFISDPTMALDGDGIDPNPDDPGDAGNSNVASSWHGTHVAGTVAAATDNSIGVAGVSWGAKIMPIRVLGFGGGTSFDVLQGVLYAAGLPNDSGTVPAQRADIINLSLGSGGFSQAEQDVYTRVHDAGVLVVAAAGNENTSLPSYPASYDGVISVAAVGLDGRKAPYSNFGTFIDIAAPGGNLRQDTNGDGFGDGVLSTVADDKSGIRQSAYAFYDGTSMAAPHVAGVLALMKAVFPPSVPLLSPDDVESLLQSGQMSIDLGTPGRDDIYGYGLVDALKAVQAAQALADGGTTGAVAANPSRVDFGVSLSSMDVELTGLGMNPPSVVSVVATEPWLTVTAASVDSNGLGIYTFTVDRSGLADATYSTEVLFNLSTGAQQQVPVSMVVMTAGSTVGDTGHLYILLLQADTFALVDLLEQDPVNGQYTYTFSDTPPGSYVIVAGTDLDDDGFICGIAETCGGYPNFNELERVTVTTDDITGLDFVASAVSGLSTPMTVGTNARRFRRLKLDDPKKALRR